MGSGGGVGWGWGQVDFQLTDALSLLFKVYYILAIKMKLLLLIYLWTVESGLQLCIL